MTYSLSPNRQRPFAGAAHAAIFNTFRRFRHQVLYVAPPFIVAYAAMNWAIERCVYTIFGPMACYMGTDGSSNEYLNSKADRLAEGTEE